MSAPRDNTGCPICGGSMPSNGTGQMVAEKYGYRIVRCAHCRTEQVHPMPSDAVLRAHYANPDYFAAEEAQGYRSYADMAKALLPHFARRLDTIERLYPARGRLLDFGCAAGYFLTLARARGWYIEGVEVSPAMAQTAARSLGITIAATVDDLPHGSFDAITLWEVVEHLPRPVEALRELHDRLRAGGVLMLSTPNTGHWQAAREPQLWPGYRPPSHLLFFDAANLAGALSRAGFERIAVRRVAPLPPLPRWLRALSTPLQRGLSTGKIRAWPLALLSWRAVRIAGWGWHRLRRADGDIFTTLEAVAFRPGGER